MFLAKMKKTCSNSIIFGFPLTIKWKLSSECSLGDNEAVINAAARHECLESQKKEKSFPKISQVHSSTYQYRVKTTYITTFFFFFLLLCFLEHCFCCLCLLFYPILYSFHSWLVLLSYPIVYLFSYCFSVISVWMLKELYKTRDYKFPCKEVDRSQSLFYFVPQSNWLD